MNFITLDCEGFLKVWDFELASINSIHNLGEDVSNIDFNRYHQNCILLQKKNSFEVFDFISGKTEKKFSKNDKFVFDCVFTKDSKWIVSITNDVELGFFSFLNNFSLLIF